MRSEKLDRKKENMKKEDIKRKDINREKIQRDNSLEKTLRVRPNGDGRGNKKIEYMK